MNDENLQPVRTKKEARDRGKQGGLKSGEARRRRRTLREELLVILSDPDVQDRMCTALVREAMAGNRAGSVTKAFEVIRDTIGEKAADELLVGTANELKVNIQVKD